VRAVVTATREVTHAACHLAAVAALLAKARPQVQDHFQLATECSSAAARLAFELDDIYRRANGSVTSLEAVDRALEAAVRAIGATRDAVRAMRPPP